MIIPRSALKYFGLLTESPLSVKEGGRGVIQLTSAIVVIRSPEDQEAEDCAALARVMLREAGIAA